MGSPECTVETCTRAIVAACSQDYVQVKQAEQMIAQLEHMPRFFPILSEMAVSGTFPPNIKHMAAICLKNGVSKFWRPTAPNSLLKEDKDAIKRVLLSTYTEPNKEVFDQLQEVIAKISRYDFPKFWPEFIPTLMEVVDKDPNEEEKLKSLILIYTVLKMLSTKRLSGDKQAYRETTELLFNVIGSLWEKYLHLFNKQPHIIYLKLSLVTMKLLRSMLSFGFTDISAPLPNACLVGIMNMATSQLLHRVTITDPHVKDLYDKYLLVMVKTLINTQERFPDTFGIFIVPVLEFAYGIGFELADSLEVRLVARSLHLLSGIMICETYDVFKLNNRGIDITPQTIKLTESRNSFFTEARLQEMCSKCISKYLKLTELELQNWQESPEEFAYEETRHVSLFNLKAASEHFLLNLTATFQDTVCPYIVGLIKECAKHDRSDLHTVLMIDSIYSVTVICSYDLFDYIDIDKWFVSLVEELRTESPFCVILRRRIIEIIGRWVTIKLSQDKHPEVYAVCLQHMEKTQDMVVRLTSASALQAAVSDFAFYPSAFSTYLGPAMELLYGLLREVEECESRVKILEVITAIVDGCGKHITPFVDPLILWLPGLWEAASEHKILQAQLINTARKLARCLGSSSPKLYPFTDSILIYSITQDRELILLEDGLLLWLTLLEYAPAITAHFLEMFACLPALLELGSDSLKTSLLIIECTILLDPSIVITRYGDAVISSCLALYRGITGEGRILVDNILLTIIKTVPKQQWPNLTPILHVIIVSLNEASDFSKVLTMNLNVLCYIILLDLPYFNHLMASFNNPQLLKNLFEVWISKTEHFYRTEQHKLSLVALLTFIPGHPELLQGYFSDVIDVIDKSIEKCTDVDSVGKRFDCVLSKHAQNAADDNHLTGESEDYKRRSILQHADLISKIDIVTFVRSKFQEFQQIIGPETFKDLSTGVDEKVTERLSSYLR